MAKKAALYDEVVAITSDYLGPAGQRFVDRQIQNHLKKEPDELRPQDMSKLIDWLRISFAFLTEDRHIIDEVTTRLANLSPKASTR